MRRFSGKLPAREWLTVPWIGRIAAPLLALAATVSSSTQTAFAAGAGKKPMALDADPSLAGRWTFDETSGKTVADSSRHARKGELKGGLSFDKNSAKGKIGHALNLPGGDGCVQIARYKGITGTQPRTASLSS